MGIRFRCHHCETELHVKDFQAGKRGRCPECRGKFRIPPTDAAYSLQHDASVDQASVALEEPSNESTQPAPFVDAEPSQSSNQSLDQDKDELTPLAMEADAIQPPPLQSTIPQALQSAAESKWYVRPPSGGQFGPAPSPVMRQWLGESRVGRDALVWCEGWPDWLIAENVFGDYFSSLEHDSIPPNSPDRIAPSKPTSAVGKIETKPAPTPPSGQVPHSTSVAVSERPFDAPASLNPTLSDRNRAGRKQNRRRNYTIMIAALTVIMLLLIGALIVVLMWPSA